jgi:hypothetical protein
MPIKVVPLAGSQSVPVSSKKRGGNLLWTVPLDHKLCLLTDQCDYTNFGASSWSTPLRDYGVYHLPQVVISNAFILSSRLEREGPGWPQ